ncbi:MAG: cytochrome C oxidase subunit IV [Actinomycetales bacterium]|nr:MAG: cytochrome C oxidase subunit IV [Actinomycetales bacterium]
MRAAIRIFLSLLLFFVCVTPFYAAWQQRNFGDLRDVAGPVALFITALMMGMVAWYLSVTHKKFDNGPDDDEEGEISDVAGDYGFFTPYSWWPLWLGLSCAVIFAGLAVGWWLFMVGVILAPIAVVGWTFEHYKGEHSN